MERKTNLIIWTESLVTEFFRVLLFYPVINYFGALRILARRVRHGIDKTTSIMEQREVKAELGGLYRWELLGRSLNYLGRAIVAGFSVLSLSLAFVFLGLFPLLLIFLVINFA